jgi:hypothetical protein
LSAHTRYPVDSIHYAFIHIDKIIDSFWMKIKKSPFSVPFNSFFTEIRDSAYRGKKNSSNYHHSFSVMICYYHCERCLYSYPIYIHIYYRDSPQWANSKMIVWRNKKEQRNNIFNMSSIIIIFILYVNRAQTVFSASETHHVLAGLLARTPTSVAP